MAFCEHCGKEISDYARACPNCGHPTRVATAASGRRTEGTAIASLILGVAGVFFCPLICSILAVIFGRQAKSKIAADQSLEGEGLATAGTVLGWVGIGLSVVAIIVIIIVAAAGGFDTTRIEPLRNVQF
jgi:uncharacterized paraquat-inducible protein A